VDAGRIANEAIARRITPITIITIPTAIIASQYLDGKKWPNIMPIAKSMTPIMISS
jgi:hypothetical protein